jgi:hypothetical protein
MNRCSTIGSSGATALVLACLCLVQTWSLDRPMVPSNGLLVHPTLLTSLICLFYSSERCRWRTNGSSNHANLFQPLHSVPRYCQFIRRCLFFSLLGFDPWKINYLLILACGIFASMGIRNVYKHMLNNLVSLIDHVVINHQNQTWTKGLWGHVRYNFVEWEQLLNDWFFTYFYC